MKQEIINYKKLIEEMKNGLTYIEEEKEAYPKFSFP